MYRAAHPIIPFHQSTTIRLGPSLLAEMRSLLHRSSIYPDRTAHRDDTIFPAPLSATTPQLDYLHRRVYAQAQTVDLKAQRLELEALALDLVAMLFARLYQMDELPSATLGEREIKRHLWRIERAKEFIHERFEQEIALTDIASSVHLSEYHFLRLFRRLTGLTPHQYLLEVRLNHALMLLRHTHKTVTEICYEAGFTALSHFIDTFGKRFSMNPSRARQASQHDLPEAFEAAQRVITRKRSARSAQ